LHYKPWFLSFLTKNFTLHAGVSIFFVLSGFILSYNYPVAFKTMVEVKNFWIKRFVRLWPLHLFTLLITIVLLPKFIPTENVILSFLANILMLGAWIPLNNFYHLFNTISWALSAEVFFYLLFPLLIKYWPTKWKQIVLMSILLPVGGIMLSNTLRIPYLSDYFPRPRAVDIEGINYINPISRLAEFVFGMLTYQIYSRFRNLKNKSVWIFTVLESLSVIIFFSGMYLARLVSDSQTVTNLIGKAGALWSIIGINIIPSSCLVLVYAFEKGFWSRILRQQIFLFLGSISFSLYIIHDCLFKLYLYYLQPLFYPRQTLAFITYPFCLMAIAFIMYWVVEKYGGQLLLNIIKAKGKIKIRSLLCFSYIQVVPILIIICLMTNSKLNRAPTGQLMSGINNPLEVNFDNKFTLKGYSMNTVDEKADLLLFWQSQKTQRLRYNLQVRFYNSVGNVLAQEDEIMSNRWAWILPNHFFIYHLTIPSQTINSYQKIALTLYENNASTNPQLPIVSDNTPGNQYVLEGFH
jgi:peptidoglycan/LPS O-acetylase OafA/YrhL